MDKVLLIDGMNAIWRASNGFNPPNQKKEGPEVSDEFVLVYNFFRNLRPIIEQFAPTKCFFVLEGHPQFRYDLFADYKTNRKIIKTGSSQENKERVFKLKDVIIDLLQHLPITLARAYNYECDDLIGTLAENMKEEDLTVLSNDSDYIQLLQRGYKSFQIYNPIKKEFMEAPAYPYIVWKSLAGDKSDNIPKILTPKKIEKCLGDAEEFKKFLSLEENRAKFSINRQLIEFKSVPDDEIIMSEGTTNFQILHAEFCKMKFNSMTNEASWIKYCKTFSCLKY